MIELLAVVGAGCLPPAFAGELAVTQTDPYSGDYRLEVIVGSGCASESDPVFENDDVLGTESFEGCNTLTAGNAFVVRSGGVATLTAGTTIIFDNGLAVESGGTLTAVIDGSLTPFAWVEDASPTSETSYHAEFFVNLDALTLPAAGEIRNFVAFSSSGTPQLRLVIQDGPALLLEVRTDFGSYHSTSAVPAASGWNKVAIAWQAVTGATASLAVNDGTPVTVGPIDTTTRRIDFVRWGIVDGTATEVSGTLSLDGFTSWR